MADLADYGIDIDTLKLMYQEWCDGAKKSDLERRYLNKPESHGKLFTSLVRQHLGENTERKSAIAKERDALVAEVARLRELLTVHGIDPDHRPS
jgi:hypothetical protein